VYANKMTQKVLYLLADALNYRLLIPPKLCVCRNVKKGWCILQFFRNSVRQNCMRDTDELESPHLRSYQPH